MARMQTASGIATLPAATPTLRATAVAEPISCPDPVGRRLPRESTPAHQTAWLYFQMGARRSLARVARERGIHLSVIERWSKAGAWVARALAYDAQRTAEDHQRFAIDGNKEYSPGSPHQQDCSAEEEGSPSALPPSFSRQPGESARAFEAFDVYVQMGWKRSIAKVAKKLGKCRTLLSRWSIRWQWVQRACDVDFSEFRRLERERRVATAKAEAEAKQSEDRRAEINERIRRETFGLSQKMFAKIRWMLDQPLETVRREQTPEGVMVTIIEPTKWWSLELADWLAKIGFKMADEAIRGEPGRVERLA